MSRLTLRPHAATRWTWCDEHPVYTLWRRNRECGGDSEADIAWRGEGVLLTRPDGVVRPQTLPREGVAFLTACADGISIEGAAAAALEVQPATDLVALMNQFLRAGVFAAMQETRIGEN